MNVILFILGTFSDNLSEKVEGNKEMLNTFMLLHYETLMGCAALSNIPSVSVKLFSLFKYIFICFWMSTNNSKAPQLSDNGLRASIRWGAQSAGMN